MDNENYREAERFIEEFKLMDFQVSLENMKREHVHVGNTVMYKDLYLIERLLPTLIEGLEQLSREVENLMNDENYIDPEVRKRFNPCIFLAQYLMRQNHTTGNNPQSHLTKLFLNYCQVEKFSRMFVKRHDSIFKLFVTSTGKESKSCDLAQMKLFVRDLDDGLALEGSLKEYMGNSKLLTKNKSDIKLSDILQELAKFAASKGMKEADFDVILQPK